MAVDTPEAQTEFEEAQAAWNTPTNHYCYQYIAKCDDVAEELAGFLQKNEKISVDEINKKVLVVTSSSKHQRNIARLEWWTILNPRWSGLYRSLC